MTSLTQTFAVSPGINYEYVYVPPASNQSETILFLHGFPSSLHSWRHQIDYFGKKGYGCLAPNLMGYGKTYSPSDFREYKTKQMVLHLVALLAFLSIDRPLTVVGHDFGTIVASRFALYEAARVRSLVLISVGYRQPNGDASADVENAIETAKNALGYDIFGYWRFFGFDDQAASLIENNVNSFIDLAFPPPEDAVELWRSNFSPTGKLKEWLENNKTLPRRANYLNVKDYNVYLGYFLEGMKPKLNWYKSQFNDVNLDDEKSLDPMIQVPTLFIGGLRDAVSVPILYAGQKQFIPNLTSIDINGTHWLMEEKYDEVNETIEKFAFVENFFF